MVVRELLEKLELKVLAGEAGLDREVSCGYVGDLLSCVMAGAAPNSVWVTVQRHPNVVAVATLVGISAVIVTEGATADPATVERANQEGIPLLGCRQRSFEVVAGLVGLGIKDRKC